MRVSLIFAAVMGMEQFGKKKYRNETRTFDINSLTYRREFEYLSETTQIKKPCL